MGGGGQNLRRYTVPVCYNGLWPIEGLKTTTMYYYVLTQNSMPISCISDTILRLFKKFR